MTVKQIAIFETLKFLIIIFGAMIAFFLVLYYIPLEIVTTIFMLALLAYSVYVLYKVKLTQLEHGIKENKRKTGAQDQV